MTRPTKADAEKRGYVVSFRVTPEEHAALAAKAAASGVLVSDFARSAALNKPLKRQASNAAPDPASFALADQLRRVGVNLNQLTRQGNIGARDISDRLNRTLSMVEQALSDIYRRSGE